MPEITTEITADQMINLRIGHAVLDEAKTGVTVLYFPEGAKVGCDISGGGPASRETPLTMPLTADNPINAIVLSGGSAYGLAASDGVMRCLENHGIGYDTGAALVPLVCQSCIYDLGYGSAAVRPDASLGETACERALADTDGGSGNIGGGIGATVGKLFGMGRAMKAGLGFYAIQAGPLQMAALVIVNALGDIYDPATGQKMAGLTDENRTGFADTRQEFAKLAAIQNTFTGNTTIGAVITNAGLSKAEMGKVASMARSAYGRCINPVGTLADGDTIYAAGVGHIPADINLVGTLAAEVMAAAIRKAVLFSQIPDSEYLQYIRGSA
ncbi:MAG: P1 family peptidase [Lachnospiraceae bacterium]|nr:P1 family peptidase [Lachnospiraceae bacterium]